MFRKASRLPFLLFAILVFCWLHPVPVAAGNIPWMTGSFYGFDAFDMYATSPDNQWLFWLSVNGAEAFQWGNWSCGVTGYCERWGYGDYTGGSAYGELNHWDGSTWLLDSTFNGAVLPGGQITRVEACYAFPYDCVWDYEYYYSFTGNWSNQWHTAANVYGWDTTSFTGSWFDMTTSTPEPPSMLLLATGGLGLAGLLRRQLKIYFRLGSRKPRVR